jgi:hypothetical protein
VASAQPLASWIVIWSLQVSSVAAELLTLFFLIFVLRDRHGMRGARQFLHYPGEVPIELWIGPIMAQQSGDILMHRHSSGAGAIPVSVFFNENHNYLLAPRGRQWRSSDVFSGAEAIRVP